MSRFYHIYGPFSDRKRCRFDRPGQSADDGVESNQPYSCPNCQTNITAEVKQKRERAADYQFYFCKACEHLFQDEHLE
jgi:predicted SprT family Zn-dependent metalloprotease